MKLTGKTSILAARCALLTVLFLSILACQGRIPFLPATATPTPRPTMAPGDCESPEPTDEDIQYALSLGDGLFDQGDWQRSFTATHQRVTASWTSVENNAVAFVDYSIFECGYGDDLLTTYFDDAYFKSIFLNYDSYAPVDECTGDNLKLWEFDATDQGYGYMFYLWAQPHPPTRLLVVSLVIPTGKPELMDRYARALFPQLPACK